MNRILIFWLIFFNILFAVSFGQVTNPCSIQEVTKSAGFKAQILNKFIIDDEFYLIYRKLAITDTFNQDLSYCQNGTFFNSYNKENLPNSDSKIFDLALLTSNDIEFEITSGCGEEDGSYLSQIKSTTVPMSYLLVEVTIPECSDYYTHIVLLKQNHSFVKLFDFFSNDYVTIYKFLDYSMLTCSYEYSTEKIHEKYSLTYNILNRKLTVIKTNEE